MSSIQQFVEEKSDEGKRDSLHSNETITRDFCIEHENTDFSSSLTEKSCLESDSRNKFEHLANQNSQQTEPIGVYGSVEVENFINTTSGPELPDAVTSCESDSTNVFRTINPTISITPAVALNMAGNEYDAFNPESESASGASFQVYDSHGNPLTSVIQSTKEFSMFGVEERKDSTDEDSEDSFVNIGKVHSKKGYFPTKTKSKIQKSKVQKSKIRSNVLDASKMTATISSQDNSLNSFVRA